jgi:prepilin-type processing-associated H-X9-DG protein
MKCHVNIGIPGQPSQAIEDAAEMELNGDVWQVVPQSASLTPRVFGAIGMIITQPKMITQAHQAADATRALSNLKQIALASMMLATDNKDRLKVDPSAVHKSLKPYLRTDEVWFDPIMKRSDMYSMNEKLINVSTTSIAKPAETILFYVGKKGEFEYPYRGRTIIAFADGHVKIVTAAQAKTYLWKP